MADLQKQVGTLTRELKEAREQQTAAADVLQVINSSTGHVEPVFAAMLKKATQLCEAAFGILWLRDGEQFQAAASHGVPAAYVEIARKPVRPLPTNPLGRLLRGERLIVSADVADEEPYRAGDPVRRALVDLGGARSAIQVALIKDDVLQGSLTVYRQEVRPFSDEQIALLQNFAAQAVIAIENARLLNETKQSLEQQTATSEVLQVINSSPRDLKPVFDAMLDKAMRLCEASFGGLAIPDGDLVRWAASRGVPEVFDDWLAHQKFRLSSLLGPSFRDRSLLHVLDVKETEGYRKRIPSLVATVELGGARTCLLVPLVKDDALVGVIVLYRQEVRAFSDKQIALLQNFAAQAVIAIANARLLRELRERTEDLTESLQQQTATADVLKIISRSAFDLQKVFDALTESACHACGAYDAVLILREAELLHVRSHHGPMSVDYDKVPISRDLPLGRSVVDRKSVHVCDLRSEELEFPIGSVMARRMDVRTMLAVPLMREQEVIGSLGLRRAEVRPFTGKQVALAETFADQAVIAIENARLFEQVQARTRDLEESLQQQTATADVLKVISSSLKDLKPVFETIGQRAEKLCNAEISAISLMNDDQIRMVSIHGTTEEGIEAIRRAYPMGRDGETLTARAIRHATVCHVSDVFSDPLYQAKDAAHTSKYRAGLAVPMIREGEVIGAIFVARQQPGHFTDAQVQLLKTFADQAVIAIENARLFGELRDQQAELARSVDELTATGDVLKIISRSSVELETVLVTLVETVMRLCRADQAYMWRSRDNVYQLLASCGLSEEGKAYFLAHPPKVDRGTVSGRVALERRSVHVPDVLKDPEYTYADGQKMAQFRTVLGVPLLREQKLLGVFSLNRNEADPFTDKEIELVTTFADQAVIAIENARLFEELRERQAGLRVTFDNMGDGVVMFGADTHLVAWNRNFQEILDLPDDYLAQRPSYSEYFRYLAHRGEYSADLEAELSHLNEDPWQELRLERTRPDGRIIELRRNPVPGGGFVLIYSDITKRKRAEEAIRAARDAAETALRELQMAQDRLIQTEKLASLGQLTAGIAHEIKNPLNFVNNFSSLSAELVDEMNDVLEDARLDEKKQHELDEIRELLKSNLEKVVQHGKRADSIVKNMLLHSRSGSSEHRPVEINAIVEESLNLAYHGARAEGRDFNIMLERDFDPAAGFADIFPQEITRVLLNLISNGLYAATKRAAAASNGFEPKLKAVTRNVGDRVQIRIRDNGMGIPPDIREKIFNPFFTTKPAGEGTGLGLSMSHDIVVKQHRGTIEVVTEPGSFTEFIIALPRVMPAQAEAGGQGH